MPTPEQKTQLAICNWIQKQYPEVFNYVIKIDNEGKRTIGGHILAAKMGLHKGASDLFIAWPSASNHHGLWMEIKPDGWRGAYGKKAKLHLENQLLFIKKMITKGYEGKLVVGVDQGMETVKQYLKEK